MRDMATKAAIRRAPRKQDRFLPCLLARLVDDEPHNRVDRNPQLFTMEQLKRNVLRNITMILNSSPRRLQDDLLCSETIRDSVLFWGLPNYTGQTTSQARIEELQQEIMHQLRCFEPRLDKDSLSVVLEVDPKSCGEFILRISGTITADPVNGIIRYEQKMAWDDAGTLYSLAPVQNGSKHE